MANPADTNYYLIAEATPGTTPATPAYQQILHVPGTMPTYVADVAASPVLQPNRTAGPDRKVLYRVEGGVATQLKRDAAHDVLLSSALSGAYATNVLKGAATDSSFTIQKRWQESGATQYRNYKGCQVTSFKLTCDASGNAETSFDILGMNASLPTATMETGATYTAAASTTQLAGIDVSAVTVAGLTATYRSLELSVDAGRELLDSFGNTSASGVGQGSPRQVKLTLTFYRANLTPETVLTGDTPIAVSFTIGSTTSGYTFTLPKATFTLPQDEEDGAKALVTVEFTGSYDVTTGTDISITKLA